MITLFFRYDDYSATSTLEVDAGLINIMEKHCISCTFAVIPSVSEGSRITPGNRAEFLLDGVRLDLLKRALDRGSVDLALHGWNHRTHSGALPPNPSEFRGLSMEEQLSIIRRGYDYLVNTTGTLPSVFVPPWNSYDNKTLKALEIVGIRCISADKYAAVCDATSIKYVPATIEMRELRSAIEKSRKHNDPDAIIGVLMHPYDFRESGDSRSSMSLAEFESEVAWLIKCPDVTVKSLSSLINGSYDLGSERFNANRPAPLETVSPTIIKNFFTAPHYKSLKHARSDRSISLMITSFFYLIVATIAATVARGLLVLFDLSDYASILVSLRSITVLALLLLIARAVKSRELYFRGMFLITLLCGILSGLFM